jgi:hypothetical protein
VSNGLFASEPVSVFSSGARGCDPSLSPISLNSPYVQIVQTKARHKDKRKSESVINQQGFMRPEDFGLEVKTVAF